MSEIGIRLAGLGGQGVVLSSVIIGRAASVFENMEAVQTQTYGSDMRGGDVCSEIIISEQKILYPIVNCPDILVVLAQKAFSQHIQDLKENGILITDKNFVEVNHVSKNIKHFCGSFNNIAIDKFKDNRVANMIMLGFLIGKTKILSQASLEKAIVDLVPANVMELNIKALHEGVVLDNNL